MARDRQIKISQPDLQRLQKGTSWGAAKAATASNEFVTAFPFETDCSLEQPEEYESIPIHFAFLSEFYPPNLSITIQPKRVFRFPSIPGYCAGNLGNRWIGLIDKRIYLGLRKRTSEPEQTDGLGCSRIRQSVFATCAKGRPGLSAIRWKEFFQA